MEGQPASLKAARAATKPETNGRRGAWAVLTDRETLELGADQCKPTREALSEESDWCLLSMGSSPGEGRATSGRKRRHSQSAQRRRSTRFNAAAEEADTAALAIAAPRRSPRSKDTANASKAGPAAGWPQTVTPTTKKKLVRLEKLYMTTLK
ncbi:hypothetical protein WJX72_000703 [[Myrmecia] bisecta]|uniref:Uncharacterized protein n=1 Tax=[Myrmecia] bisecta TaxID=41462 RepID=A0AAW1PK78_9CHLO